MARRQNCVRIIMYHGITDSSADAFREQLAFLVRHFKVVSLPTMIERLASDEQAGAANEIVLTFDDGLRNNFTVVYPLLREFQAPAAFFVCPGLIETGNWLWNHEARCRLQSLRPAELSALCARLPAPDQSPEKIVEWMKTLPMAQRRNAENVIRNATPNFQPTPQQQNAFNIMSWNDLAALDSKLITIGSHTLTHPILTTLIEAEITEELRASRRCLEEKLQRPVDFFCYPNGSYDARIYDAAKTIYRAAVTTECGTVAGNDADLHRLPRIPSAENPALTAWRLHRPEA